MKQYMIFLLLVLIISCAPTVEVDRAKPVEDVQEPEEIVEEAPEEVILEEEEEENTIEIKEDSFYPVEKVIGKNTEIKWVKKDTRDYRITCYLEGTRVIQSPDLKYGDSFTHVFLKEGEYTCITVPYGLRNIITVEAEKALLSPTGSAAVSESKDIKETVFASISMLIAVVIFLLFIYFNRREGLYNKKKI